MTLRSNRPRFHVRAFNQYQHHLRPATPRDASYACPERLSLGPQLVRTDHFEQEWRQDGAAVRPTKYPKPYWAAFRAFVGTSSSVNPSFIRADVLTCRLPSTEMKRTLAPERYCWWARVTVFMVVNQLARAKVGYYQPFFFRSSPRRAAIVIEIRHLLAADTRALSRAPLSRAPLACPTLRRRSPSCGSPGAGRGRRPWLGR